MENPPSTEEIERVAEYWQYVQNMVCHHDEIVFTHDGTRCGQCDRPVKMLSDIQLAEIDKGLEHKNLLKKYMKHVGIAEGSDFLNEYYRNHTKDEVAFTDDEWQKLEAIAEET